MKIKKVQKSETTWQYLFICPGCNEEHAFNDGWEFNQDYDKPTISPSYLIHGYTFDDAEPKRNSLPFRCHSFIKDGMIEYLDDCTHLLKNQTVELPDYEDNNRIG